jgi:lipopolysaccharide export system permease protein
LANWWDGRGAASADAPSALPRRLWFRNGGEIVAVDAVSLDGAHLGGVLIVRRGEDGSLASRIEARGAEHDAAAGWMLREASVVRPPQARTEAIAEVAWPDGPSPEAMRDLARPTEAQPLDRLLAGSRGEGAVARGAAYFATRVQAAVAALATPFLMLLLAAPAAFGLPRGSVAPRAAVGVGLGLGYLVVAGLLGALGEASVLPPALAAWTAPLLFAAAGVLLLQREEG